MSLSDPVARSSHNHLGKTVGVVRLFTSKETVSEDKSLSVEWFESVHSQRVGFTQGQIAGTFKMNINTCQREYRKLGESVVSNRKWTLMFMGVVTRKFRSPRKTQ